MVKVFVVRRPGSLSGLFYLLDCFFKIDFGMVDFSKQSDEELEDSLGRIDQKRFPENYSACLAEIEKRKVSGVWQQQDQLISSEIQTRSTMVILVVFCGIGILMALFALFVFVQLPSSKGTLFFLGFSIVWCVISLSFTSNFFKRYQMVLGNHSSFFVRSLMGDKSTDVPYDHVRSIGLIERRGNGLGEKYFYIKVKTLQNYYFGQEFCFHISQPQVSFNRLLLKIRDRNPSVIDDSEVTVEW